MCVNIHSDDEDEEDDDEEESEETDEEESCTPVMNEMTEEVGINVNHLIYLSYYPLL